jgi:hypothetical protein
LCAREKILSGRRNNVEQRGFRPYRCDREEPARLLSTNDKQIRRGIYARELPVVRFGNSYSIGVDDLMAWFNRKKATL